MTFQEIDTLIADSGRRSIASALIAHLLDAIDRGEDGLDLDAFQNQTRFFRNNVTVVASYLQYHELIQVLYYRESTDERQYDEQNNYGRWSKQHYRPSPLLIQLYHRD